MKNTSLRAVSLIAAGTMFMENLDATAIVTALPAMADDFGATPTAVSLGISGYMFGAVIGVPLSAWLADRIGTRTVLTAAIALFALASLLCGISGTIEMFVAMRVLQGAAAALMSPVARLVVFRNTPKSELMQAVAIITWPSLIAPVLGPPLGGVLTTYASWHWIFFINLPVAIIGIAATRWFVPEQKADERMPFDMPGFLLVTGALGGIIFGLHLLSDTSGDWALAAAIAAGGIMMGVLAVRHVRRRASPIVTLDALAIPSFAITAIGGGALSRAAISATPFLLPLLLQIAFGYSPVAAGAMVLIYFVGNIGMKTITTPLIRSIGFRNILLFNGVAVGLSLFAFAAIQPSSPVPLLALLLLAAGAARSLQMTALNSIAFADVPTEQTSPANTLFTMIQQIAMTAGVAVGALLLNISLSARGGATLTLVDFQAALIVVGVMGLCAVMSFRHLAPDAGANVSGHRPKQLTG